MENLTETKRVVFDETLDGITARVDAVLDTDNNIQSMTAHIETEDGVMLGDVYLPKGLDVAETLNRINAVALAAKEAITAKYPQNNED